MLLHRAWPRRSPFLTSCAAGPTGVRYRTPKYPSSLTCEGGEGGEGGVGSGQLIHPSEVPVGKAKHELELAFPPSHHRPTYHCCSPVATRNKSQCSMS
jgi:hypothetical protein